MADEPVFLKFGKFIIEPARELDGELRVAVRSSSLYVTDAECFDPVALSDRHIFGTLHDLTRVTLLQCISAGVGSVHGREEGYFHANIFPHYVLEGRRHLSPREK